MKTDQSIRETLAGFLLMIAGIFGLTIHGGFCFGILIGIGAAMVIFA